ncbi:GTP-binding protein rho2 [Nadsonia fulvescens var. elongata DSM 6958]|uniref:GTP-binding protein rho2 n=1 Tax=Nadsonia fulvescens var. elongata DSM 6958 TaxID=857566 RepID=A0A1E3PPA7_9ASCO|nr:GTP-binding protein rho2 [Nadsonia fulvescens var. elongata DSM 6958]
MSRENYIRRKLVIVGDGACGKTSLLCVFTLGEFPKHPTVFENYVTDCRVDGKSVQLALWDTAGQEEYERLRPLSYHKAHCILIGFSVDTPDSLDNVKIKWIDEVNELCPNVPVILVGLKRDLRPTDNSSHNNNNNHGSGSSTQFVQAYEAEQVAKQIGARRYLECSSLTGQGVDDVFEVATRASLLMLNERSQPKSSCCIVL